MLSQRLNHFLVCLGCDKIISPYAKHTVPVHVKTDNIFPLAEHTRKFVRRMLSVRWIRFLVCSVCDKIVSAYVQHAQLRILYFSKINQKSQIKMQISTLKNTNFEKPFRKPSIKTQGHILKKKNLWISLQKNLVPYMFSHRENVRTSKFWRKSKEKKRNFFENLPRAYKDMI